MAFYLNMKYNFFLYTNIGAGNEGRQPENIEKCALCIIHLFDRTEFYQKSVLSFIQFFFFLAFNFFFLFVEIYHAFSYYLYGLPVCTCRFISLTSHRFVCVRVLDFRFDLLRKMTMSVWIIFFVNLQI